MQCLRAGAERGEDESLDGRGVLVQEGDPLVECEPPRQVVDALRHGQRGATERKPIGGGQGRRSHEAHPLKQAGFGVLKRFDNATGLTNCQCTGGKGCFLWYHALLFREKHVINVRRQVKRFDALRKKAAHEHPDAGARALAGRRSHVIALAVPLRTDVHVPIMMERRSGS
ncbi:hypothetical protein ADK65_08755 [Streptomyces sp. NRRL B-1140]|nr:hypothetical protein ADK65_08755 [Streptomyces sp. NRRL B-1140]